MEFPIIDLTVEKWDFAVASPVSFSENTQTYRETKFIKYFYGRYYCDCQGVVYQVIAKEHVQSFWRSLFRFIPGVPKVKLVFVKTESRLGVEEVRHFILDRLESSDMLEHSLEWQEEIKNATDIKGLLFGDQT